MTRAVPGESPGHRRASARGGRRQERGPRHDRLRSENMRRIRSNDTGPELRVRRFLHRSGLRYSLHRPDLPGRPDLVFASTRSVVFVHGCFWHGCRKCQDGRRRVKSRVGYWAPKIAGNRKRDLRNRRRLLRLGWKVFVVWECQLESEAVLTVLARALSAERRRAARRRSV